VYAADVLYGVENGAPLAVLPLPLTRSRSGRITWIKVVETASGAAVVAAVKTSSTSVNKHGDDGVIVWDLLTGEVIYDVKAPNLGSIATWADQIGGKTGTDVSCDDESGELDTPSTTARTNHHHHQQQQQQQQQQGEWPSFVFSFHATGMCEVERKIHTGGDESKGGDPHQGPGTVLGAKTRDAVTTATTANNTALGKGVPMVVIARPGASLSATTTTTTITAAAGSSSGSLVVRGKKTTKGKKGRIEQDDDQDESTRSRKGIEFESFQLRPGTAVAGLLCVNNGATGSAEEEGRGRDVVVVTDRGDVVSTSRAKQLAEQSQPVVERRASGHGATAADSVADDVRNGEEEVDAAVMKRKSNASILAGTGGKSKQQQQQLQLQLLARKTPTGNALGLVEGLPSHGLPSVQTLLSQMLTRLTTQ